MCNSVALNAVPLSNSRSPEHFHLVKLKLYADNNSFLPSSYPGHHYSPLCFCAFAYFMYVGEIIRCLSSSDWLISLYHIASSFICIVAHGRMDFFLFFFQGWTVFHCVFLPHFFLSFHSLIDIWVAFTSWLCGQYCCELGCEISLQDVALSSSGYVPKVDLLDLSAFSFKFGSSSTMKTILSKLIWNVSCIWHE